MWRGQGFLYNPRWHATQFKYNLSTELIANRDREVLLAACIWVAPFSHVHRLFVFTLHAYSPCLSGLILERVYWR